VTSAASLLIITAMTTADGLNILASKGPGQDTKAFIQKAFACSPEVAHAVGLRAVEKRWPARAAILRQGDTGGETFLLLAGRAHALLYGLDGQLVLLNEFLPGDLFGAIAQADPGPHEADVTAMEESRAAIFAALDFLGLMEAHGCVGLAVSRQLLRQLRHATGKMVERTTLSAAGRVYSELLRLARGPSGANGEKGDGMTISPPPVLAALAVRVQSTRETVSRTINALERRGLIRRAADALVLVAPDRLEEMVI
jgi:CRP-like cAMP-binding protein